MTPNASVHFMSKCFVLYTKHIYPLSVVHANDQDHGWTKKPVEAQKVDETGRLNRFINHSINRLIAFIADHSYSHSYRTNPGKLQHLA